MRDAAANSDHNAPENKHGISGVLDGGTEANDGEGTHHAKGQGDIAGDDSHNRGGNDGHGHEGNAETAVIGYPRRSKVICRIHRTADHKRNEQLKQRLAERHGTLRGKIADDKFFHVSTSQ